MSLFNKQKTYTKLPNLTPAVAKVIYGLIKDTDGGNLSEVFINHGYKIGWIKQVWVEAKRLEQEAITYCRDNKTVTLSAIKAILSSNLLEINDVGADILHYNPTFDDGRTFTEFRSSYPYIAPVEEPEE